MREQKMVESFDGVKLFMEKSLKSDMVAISVLVHGLAEHSGRYEYLEDMLNKENIGVYRFDHRGHGKSEGERAFYQDFNELIDDINFIVELAKKENPNLPVYLIGHSMGGFGVTAFGTKYQNKVNGIIASGGFTRDNNGAITSIPMELDPYFQLPNELADGVCSVEEVCRAYENDPLNCKYFTAGLAQSMTKGIVWLKANANSFNYPILMLHGAADGLISYQDSLDSFKEVSSKDKQVKIYGNLYHEIFNEYAKDEVIKDVIEWIKNRI